MRRWRGGSTRGRSVLLEEGGCAIGGAHANGAAGKCPVEGHAVHVGLRVGRGRRLHKGDECESARLVRVLVPYHLPHAETFTAPHRPWKTHIHLHMLWENAADYLIPDRHVVPMAFCSNFWFSAETFWLDVIIECHVIRRHRGEA